MHNNLVSTLKRAKVFDESIFFFVLDRTRHALALAMADLVYNIVAVDDIFADHPAMLFPEGCYDWPHTARFHEIFPQEVDRKFVDTGPGSISCSEKRRRLAKAVSYSMEGRHGLAGLARLLVWLSESECKEPEGALGSSASQCANAGQRGGKYAILVRGLHRLATGGANLDY